MTAQQHHLGPFWVCAGCEAGNSWKFMGCQFCGSPRPSDDEVRVAEPEVPGAQMAPKVTIGSIPSPPSGPTDA